MKCRRRDHQKGFPDPSETPKKGIEVYIKASFGYCEMFNILT
jgi:hypothetical protein